MEIRAEAKISHPRELTFRTLRDRLAEVAEYMPNIRKIDVGERQEPESDIVTFVNVWYGKGDDIPAVAKPFIKPDMIRWKDYARWDESEWACEWRSETAFMTDRVHVSGKNFYEDNGDDTCTLTITGNIEVDPPLFAKAAKGAIEKYVVGLLKPNLLSTADAVQEFLEDQA